MRRLGWLAVVGGAVVLAVLATWFALDLLLGEANQAGAAQRPAARIDAIRTGLTVAAGAGALIALGLALRRQWYTEHDSRERRITDLYVQAVEQLGSERAPVRLGGLYALSRLGQGNPGHRQTVMDVLCAYLRMPFEEDGPVDELQVRQTAQHLLGDHLFPHGKGKATFWPDMNVDLSGATLVGFSLTHCQAGFGDFYRAKFTGDQADFDAAVFTWATFRDATFVGEAPKLPSGWHAVSGEHEGEWWAEQVSDAVDGDRVEGAG